MIKGGKFLKKLWCVGGDEGLTLETSALETHDGQFTFKIFHLSLFTVDKTKLSMCTLVTHEYQLFDVIFSHGF